MSEDLETYDEYRKRIEESELRKNYYSSSSGNESEEEEGNNVCTIHEYSRIDAIYRLNKSTQLCIDCVKHLAIPYKTMYGCSVCSSVEETCFTLKKTKFRICKKCYKILLWKMDNNMNINK